MTPRRKSRAAARRDRERRIIDATRALFDDRGMQEARIDLIARRARINRALIYRHFASKKELFALTITRYLDEIADLLQAVDETASSRERLRQGFESFARYGIAHPAFLDCAFSLLRQPADELRGEVSEAVWFRLGRSMGACLGWLAGTLAILGVERAELRANELYLEAIGLLHLARSGVGLRVIAPGAAQPFAVSTEEVEQACVRLALDAVDAEGQR